MNGTDLAYMAGLLDGEGSIGIDRIRTGVNSTGVRRTMLNIKVSVTNTNIKAVDCFHRAFGGKILQIQRKGGNWKPVYVWSVQARKAEKVIRSILPFLRLKREQAEIALMLRDHMKHGGIVSRGLGFNRNPERDLKIIEFREGLKEKMMILNKRGVI